MCVCVNVCEMIIISTTQRRRRAANNRPTTNVSRWDKADATNLEQEHGQRVSPRPDGFRFDLHPSELKRSENPLSSSAVYVSMKSPLSHTRSPFLPSKIEIDLVRAQSRYHKRSQTIQAAGASDVTSTIAEEGRGGNWRVGMQYWRVCMYVCMVITYSRVWINPVRLSILLVVR